VTGLLVDTFVIGNLVAVMSTIITVMCGLSVLCYVAIWWRIRRYNFSGWCFNFE
jgi:hypothetical protein